MVGSAFADNGGAISIGSCAYRFSDVQLVSLYRIMTLGGDGRRHHAALELWQYTSQLAERPSLFAQHLREINERHTR